MIRVVQFAEFGPPDVLRTVTAPVPEPVSGQVRIAVEAAGVQPFDAALRRGDMQAIRPMELPGRVGNEVAGTVEAAGPNTTTPIGSEVIAFLDMQGYASHVIVPETQLVPKPVDMGWAEAGGLSVSGQTASTALEALGIGPDDRLLIHAAAGGVGSIAVQIARIHGARVIGTASERNHDFLRSSAPNPSPTAPASLTGTEMSAPKASLSPLMPSAVKPSMSRWNSSATRPGSSP